MAGTGCIRSGFWSKNSQTRDWPVLELVQKNEQGSSCSLFWRCTRKWSYWWSLDAEGIYKEKLWGKIGPWRVPASWSRLYKAKAMRQQDLWSRGKLCRVEGKRPVGIERKMEQDAERDCKRRRETETIWPLVCVGSQKFLWFWTCSWVSLWKFNFLGWPECVLCNPMNLFGAKLPLQQWRVGWMWGTMQDQGFWLEYEDAGNLRELDWRHYL